MIYVVDIISDHSKSISSILQCFTNESITSIAINPDAKLKEIYQIFIDLIDRVNSKDIVLCPWCIEANDYLDSIVDHLAAICNVVVAAGNFNRPVDSYSPARASLVTTVACLNKSGIKAALSNYSKTKDLIWIPGTNFWLDGKPFNGTSISAAVYAGLLSKCSQDSSLNLKFEIDNYKQKVFSELNKSKQEITRYGDSLPTTQS